MGEKSKKKISVVLTMLILCVLVIGTASFALAADSQPSDSSIMESIGKFFIKIGRFFSGGGITGLSISDPAYCFSGLVSYWTFDAGDAVDDYGYNDGTVNGPVQTTGLVSDALGFDGVNDHIIVPADPSLENDYITISAWINNGNANYAADGTMVNKKNTYPGTYILWIANSDEKVKFRIRLDGSESTGRDIVSNTALGSGSWKHLVARYNGTHQNMWIDGVKQTDQNVLTGVLDKDNSNNLHIGSHPDINRFFKGAVDEFAIYDRALSVDEIQELYMNGLLNLGYCEDACGNGVVESGEECDDGNQANGDGCSDVCVIEFACTDVDGDTYSPEGGICGEVDCNDNDENINPDAAEICDDAQDNDCNSRTDDDDSACRCLDGPSDIVSYWSYDAGDAADDYGYNDGSLNGGAAVSGKMSRAISFDGNDNIVVPDSDSLDVAGEITVAGWFYTDTYNQNGQDIAYLIAKQEAYLMRLGEPDKPEASRGFGISIKDQDTAYSIYSGEYPTLDEWHFVAATYDGDDLKIYVDGVLENSISHTGSINVNENDLIFGQYIGGGFNFKGKMDEIIILSRALTSEEVEDMYDLGYYEYNYCEIGPVCGNNVVEAWEDCDDGNTVPGDGCSEICENECTDSDGDTFSPEGGICGLTDCDDNDENIYPGAAEVCDDAQDNDCDTYTDDQDTECRCLDGVSSVISYWSFDAGDAADDFDHNPGVVTGATATPGQINGALSFDGNDFIAIADSESLDTPDELSIAGWFYTETYDQNGYDLAYVAARLDSFLLRLGESSKPVTDRGFGFTIKDVDTAYSIYSGEYPSLFEWHFVVGTYDGNALKIYVDGELKGTTPHIGSINVNNNDLYMGKYEENGFFYNGKMDELALYSRALTLEEVESMYQMGIYNYSYCDLGPVCGNNVVEGWEDCDDGNTAPDDGCSEICENECNDVDGDTYAAEGGACGPVDCDDNDENIYPGAAEVCDDAKDNDCDGSTDLDDTDCKCIDGPADIVSYWTFDAGDAADDFNGNPGTITGATATAGNVGGALNFDGNDHLVISDSDNLDTADELTLAGWFYVSTEDQNVYNLAYVAAKLDSFLLRLGEPSKPVSARGFGFTIKDVNTAYTIYSGEYPTLDEWHFVAATYDGDDLKIYVDGELKGTTPHVGSINVNNNDLYIGKYQDNGFFYRGKIDEFALYSRALTVTELEELYFNKGRFHKGYCEAACTDDDRDASSPDGGDCGDIDCDDNDVTIYYGAPEVLCDTIDQDCSGADDTGTDADSDGYKIEGGLCGPVDCDDHDDVIYPTAPELCDNKDNDCNTLTDDHDQVAPVTTDNVPVGWSTDDVTVTLAPTDNTGGCGIRSTLYCVDISNTCTPNIPGTSITITDEGVSYVRYQSIDNSEFTPGGNVEAVKSATVMIDKSDPGTTDEVDTGGMGTSSGWFISKPVLVTLTPEDTVSGIAHTYYCVDSTNTCTPNIEGTEVSLVDEGDNYVRYYSVDVAGNVEPVVAGPFVQIDTVDPVTTHTVSGTPGDNNWYISDAAVSLSATDATSGVALTKYCIDSTNQCDPDQFLFFGDISVTNEGVNYVRYRTSDNAENEEDTKSVMVKVDKSDPSASVTALPQYTGVDSITITWTGDDTVSGINKYELYRNDMKIHESASTSYLDLGLSDATSYTYYVKAIDNSGRTIDSAATTTTIDLLPPTVPVMGPLPQYTTTSNILTGWSVSVDATSGLNHYDLYKDADPALDVGIAQSYDDTSVIEGQSYTYSASATDNVNHESEQSDAVSTIIDTVAPISSHAIAGTVGSNGWYKDTAIGVTLSAVDGTSGVMKTFQKIDAGAYEEYTGAISLDNGQYAISYYSQDNAGNTENEKSFNINVDSEVPSTTDDAPVGWQNSQVDITLSVSETVSGVDSTKYCIDTVNTCTPDIEGTLVSVLAEGENYVRYRTLDIAGNEEGVNSVQVKIDLTVPTITDDYALDGQWTNTDQLSNLIPNDAPSGVSEVTYCEGTGCSPATVLAAPYQLAYSADQDTVVRYRVVDIAGNPGLIGEYNVKLDKTSPTAAALADPGEWSTDGSVSLSWSGASDLLSGLADYVIFRKDGAGGVFSDVSGEIGLSTSWSDTGLVSNVEYFYKIRVYDLAGNYIDSNIESITVDTEHPSAGITYPSNGQIFAQDSLTVTADYANEFNVVCTVQDNAAPEVGMDGDDQVAGTAFYTFTGLSEGEHTFLVDCVDQAGLHSTDSVTVEVDTVAPSTASSFTDPGWKNSDISIDLSCSDSGTGCLETVYCIDDSDSCTPTTTFTSTIVQNQEGTYYIRFQSSDIAGNQEAVNSQILKLDKTIPSVSDDYTKDGVWTNQDQSVTLSASDIPSGVSEVRYCTGAGCIPSSVISDPYQFAYTVDQDTVIRYMAVDNAENPSLIDQYNVKLDKTAPSAPVVGALDQWNTVGEVTLTWSVSTDTLSGFSHYEVWRNEDGGVYHKVSPDLATEAYADTGLVTDTTYNYKIIVFDNADNYAESNEVSTTVDTENPSAQFVVPLSNSIYTVDTLTAYVDFANTYNVNCQMKVDDELMQDMDGDDLINGTASLLFSSLSEGLHNFYVECEDEAGNKQTDTVFDVRIDTLAPATSSSFTSLDWQNSDISVDLSCIDQAPGSGCFATYYCIDDEDACIPYLPFTGTIVHSIEGTSYIRFLSMDEAGNEEAVQSQIMKLDKTKPLIVDDYASDGEWVNTPQTITLTPTDESSGVAQVTYCEGASCVASNVLSTPYQLTYSADEIVTVRYQAEDTAGNLADIGSFQLKLDQTDPSAPVLADPGVWSTTGSVTLVWTDSTDALSGIDHYEVLRKTTGAYQKVSPDLSGTTFTDSGLPTDTTYYFKIVAYDAAGNFMESNEQSITVDTEAPSVQISSPSNNEMFTVDTIDVIADFANTYNVNCEVKIDGESFIGMDGDDLISGTATYTFTDVADGLHDITVICTDEAGHLQTDVVQNIRVDTVSPVTEDDYDYDSIWSNEDALIVLSVSDADPSSGIEFTKYCIDATGTCDPVSGSGYSGAITIDTEGTQYVRYQSKDNAGNLEAVHQITVAIDKSAPALEISLTEDAAAGCGFWSQLWTDAGQINQYDVIHGCAEISAVIDASISGLESYAISLIDSDNNTILSSSGSALNFNFDTEEDAYTILVEATDNADNFNSIALVVYEDDDEDVFAFPGDDGGAPDIYDRCPGEIPEIDADKDGCEDSIGVEDEAIWCIDTFTGKSDASIYPTSALTLVEGTYYKPWDTQQKYLWYDLQSDINDGVQADYDLNVIHKEWNNNVFKLCSIDPEQLITSDGLILKYGKRVCNGKFVKCKDDDNDDEDDDDSIGCYLKRDRIKLFYWENEATGIMRVNEHYHNHWWTDGSKVHATMHYRPHADNSRLHLVYNNKEKRKDCLRDAKDDKNACRSACAKRDKQCKRACYRDYKEAVRSCTRDNHYQIKEIYDGYKTLSIYDILKLIEYE